mmetsp:Transcript_48464/g.151985  ORF Transcript_48464/g.151985 Transcript_48464/m.151985 type:complete len:208 (-) Transcript_48464:1111-1734(-)
MFELKVLDRYFLSCSRRHEGRLNRSPEPEMVRRYHEDRELHVGEPSVHLAIWRERGELRKFENPRRYHSNCGDIVHFLPHTSSGGTGALVLAEVIPQRLVVQHIHRSCVKPEANELFLGELRALVLVSLHQLPEAYPRPAVSTLSLPRVGRRRVRIHHKLPLVQGSRGILQVPRTEHIVYVVFCLHRLKHIFVRQADHVINPLQEGI